jgi:hypothetical protein
MLVGMRYGISGKENRVDEKSKMATPVIIFRKNYTYFSFVLFKF